MFVRQHIETRAQCLDSSWVLLCRQFAFNFQKHEGHMAHKVSHGVVVQFCSAMQHLDLQRALSIDMRPHCKAIQQMGAAVAAGHTYT